MRCIISMVFIQFIGSGGGGRRGSVGLGSSAVSFVFCEGSFLFSCCGHSFCVFLCNYGIIHL